MNEIMTSVGNAILNWAIQIWNACMNSWLLAVPIALAIMARIFELLKRFLGK